MLSQYALLWAADNPGLVDRLVILNTPLTRNAKLRPELVRARACAAGRAGDTQRGASARCACQGAGGGSRRTHADIR